MKKASKKPVNWGKRPSAQPKAAPVSADDFVQGNKTETVRLNLNIPRQLHIRLKAQCAIQERNMTDAVIELLETHFPPGKGV